MKQVKCFSTICAVAFALAITGCKKNANEANTVTEDVVEAKFHSDDAATFDGETDAVDDDVNNIASSSAKFCGAANIFGGGVSHIPEGVDTASSANTESRIVVTFGGTMPTGSCRKRTGKIIIDLLYKSRWVEAGAVLKYTFVDFKVEDICKNKSIKLNGERYVTNVNGGNLVRLKAGFVNSLVHKVRNGASGLTVTFTDSTGTKTANWNAARRTEIKFDSASNGFYFTVNGDTTLNGVANTASWGNTRNGKTYTTVINTAIKSNTNCKLWRPTAGFITHTVGTFPFTVQYGLNASGTVVTSGCATNYKVSWTIGGGGSSLIAYR